MKKLLIGLALLSGTVYAEEHKVFCTVVAESVEEVVHARYESGYAYDLSFVSVWVRQSTDNIFIHKAYDYAYSLPENNTFSEVLATGRAANRELYKRCMEGRL